jgi:hypothetical protein
VQDAIEAVRSGNTAEAAVAADGQEDDQQQQYTAPKGGTTDVGQHTGGLPRDTAWPVVRAVLQVGCLAFEELGLHPSPESRCLGVYVFRELLLQPA